jgi:hypothetical protein
MSAPEMWRCVGLVRTDVSDELSCIFRVERISALGTTLAVDNYG